MESIVPFSLFCIIIIKANSIKQFIVNILQSKVIAFIVVVCVCVGGLGWVELG